MSTSIELSSFTDSHSCKFCLDDISLSSKESYITPCKCKGSIQYIHKNCLSQFFSHYKTTSCSLCKSSFTFIPWYYYLVSALLSLLIYFIVFYLYFNFQLTFLWVYNYPSYTYTRLVQFKLHRVYFLLFDFWLTSLILIVCNLILNNGPQLHILDLKIISTLPFLSIKLIFKSILIKFITYYLSF